MKHPHSLRSRLLTHDLERVKLVARSPIIAALEKVCADPAHMELSPSVSLSSSDYIHVNAVALSFQAVPPFLRDITKATGLRQTHTETRASSYYYQMDFVHVNISMPSTPDARCKVVQIGTKVVPVYGIKCDEKPATIAEPDALPPPAEVSHAITSDTFPPF
jgi:hypothetical protein